MNTPLPLIEFAVFIGVVLYLFTMQSSPSRPDASSDKQADGAGDGGTPAAATSEEPPAEQERGPQG